MPQWIPQNIQKRLLLYVLQQLSLFSEIDLPNLEEVSLGNIILRDIAIDPEKVGKIPGCNLRNGSVGYLELSTVGRAGLMGGGVNIDATNVEVVISPDFDVEEDISSSVQFSLMQSTANLANTIIVDTESDDDDEFKQPPSSPSSGNSATSKPSALSGVMAKAVEMALSRLSINITNFKIKMISELTEVVLEIDRIVVSTVNEVRNIRFSGVRLITIKPSVNPGEGTDSDRTNYSSETSSEDEDDGSLDYGEESLMDSVVFSHEEASSIYMSATSQAFTKEEPTKPTAPPTAVHIDSIAIEFEGLSRIRNLKVDVGDIKIAFTPLAPTISSIFDGISRSLKIKRHLQKRQNVKSETKSNLKFPQYNENDEVSEEDETARTAEDTNDPFFNKIHVSSIIMSATSALSSKGEFMSSNTLNFILRNLNIKQKNEQLVYGGIEQFSVQNIHGGIARDIFNFDSADLSGSSFQGDSVTKGSPGARPASAKADIRFEVFKKIEGSEENLEITTLLSKNAHLELTVESLMILSNFGKSISSIGSSYKSMKILFDLGRQKPVSIEKRPDELQQNSNPQFVLQTALIYISLALQTDSSIRSIISSINYNLQQNVARISNVQISHISKDNLVTQIGEILSIKLVTSLQDFNAFMDSNIGTNSSSSSLPRQFIATSPITTFVNRISLKVKLEDLQNLLKQITSFTSEFSQFSSSQINSLENSIMMHKSSPEHSHLFVPTGLSASHRRMRPFGQTNPLSKRGFMKVNRTNNSAFCFSLKEMDIELLDILPKFGSIKFTANNILFYEISSAIHGSVHTLNLHRPISDDSFENLVGDFQKRSIDQLQHPLIIINAKFTEKVNTVDIVLHNLLFEYHTKWLELLDKERPVEEVEVHLSNSKGHQPSKSSKRFDIRFSLVDCALALNPRRLDTKAYVIIERGSSELTFGEQFYVKSSLRDITLLLIDDIKNEEAFHAQAQEKSKLSIPSYLSPLAYYLALGYIKVGKSNCMHVGITFNNHLEETIKRNEKLSITDKPALLDIKVNSDEHQLELCADSTQALLQLVNDLKLPLDFKDEDKMKVTVDHEINLLSDIYDQFRQDLASKTSSRDLGLDASNKSTDSIIDFDEIDEDFDYLQKSIATIDQDLQQVTLTQNSNKSSHESSNQSSLAMDEEHFVGNGQSTVVKKVDPIRLNIYLAKIKIYLYDGYDWKMTRKSIKAAVKRVEEQAINSKSAKNSKDIEKDQALQGAEPESRKSRNIAFETIAEAQENEEGESEEEKENSDYFASSGGSYPDSESDAYGETLFKSIHLALPKGASPAELTDTINKAVQYNNTSNNSESPESLGKAQLNVDVNKNYKNLKIRRSSYHKTLIEAKNLEIGVNVHSTRDPRKNFTDENMKFELLNSVEIRLEDLIVYDNVPTSTWNKFLGYMNSIGKREIGTSILKIALTNVRPSPNLVAGEAIAKISVLPLRLHVDQDTLDFLSRFFGFKDARFELPPDEITYLQKFQISTVTLKLDYKPKKIDYVGMRSGKTSELMNIFILDGSDLTLEKVTLHGIHGFEKLGTALGQAWAPSIQQTQLAGLIAGLSPLRSIVNIGGGVKDLIAIPIKEYKKDKRLIRSLQKGTLSFAKTAGYEIVNLGAKLASGTQVILEQGEEFLGGEGSSARSSSNRPSVRKKKIVETPDRASGSTQKKTDLFTSSQHLHQSIKIDKDQYGSRKLYSHVDIDDDDDDTSAFDKELLSKSIFLLDSSPKKNAFKKSTVASENDKHYELEDDEIEDFEEESEEKMVSLYSNQPETIKQGLKSAYKSFGKNLSATKRTLVDLKNEMNDSETFQESLASVLRSSPVILIRPMIGTTEALSKALMGLSNEIDSKRIIESRDKYRYDKKSTGGRDMDNESDEEDGNKELEAVKDDYDYFE